MAFTHVQNNQNDINLMPNMILIVQEAECMEPCCSLPYQYFRVLVTLYKVYRALCITTVRRREAICACVLGLERPRATPTTAN